MPEDTSIPAWTATEFPSFGRALQGGAYGWLTSLVRRQGVSNRTVRRWAGEHTPADLVCNEWILGEVAAGKGREYLIHTRPPRFLARMVNRGADIQSSEVYEFPPDHLLCEFQWLDSGPVAPEDLQKLLTRVATGRIS